MSQEKPKEVLENRIWGLILKYRGLRITVAIIILISIINSLVDSVVPLYDFSKMQYCRIAPCKPNSIELHRFGHSFSAGKEVGNMLAVMGRSNDPNDDAWQKRLETPKRKLLFHLESLGISYPSWHTSTITKNIKREDVPLFMKELIEIVRGKINQLGAAHIELFDIGYELDLAQRSFELESFTGPFHFEKAKKKWIKLRETHLPWLPTIPIEEPITLKKSTPDGRIDFKGIIADRMRAPLDESIEVAELFFKGQ